VSTFPLLELDEGLIIYVRRPCRSWKLPRGVPSWRSDLVSSDARSGVLRTAGYTARFHGRLFFCAVHFESKVRWLVDREVVMM
jgi:hypothetical protein